MSYIPWWQRMTPPTFAERFDLGGLAGRVGFSRGTTLASAPWLRGTTGPNQILKAPRSKTGMADILKHEGAAIGALTVNQFNKAKKEKSVIPDDKEPMPPKEEPPKDPIPEVVEDLAIQELIENYRKSKTREGSTQPIMKDYEKIDIITSVVDTFKNKYNRLPAYTELKNFFPKLGSKEITRLVDEGEIELLPEYIFREINKEKLLKTKHSSEYINKMREYVQNRAVTENKIAVSQEGPFKDNPEVFFPKTITYNGKTYDAKEFFMNNLIEKAKHGKWRQTGKTTLKNEELAKIFNTNVRMIEKAITVIRNSPEWDVKEPASIPRSYHETVSLERIINANKNLSSVELKNVNIQDNWIWEANQDLGSRSLKSVKKNKPKLIEELQWKLVDGEIVQVERSDEKLAEDLKKFFSVNHNVKRSTEQFNIQTLVNRGLTTNKINYLLNSIEAYIKKNPTHIRKIQSMDKFLRKRGLRVRIDGVSEELLDKLGKKNNFFGADPSPKGMFNSGTGQSVQWEKYLKFLDLALDGPKGVPLIKMAQGGPVLFSSGGLSGVDQYMLNRYK
jgi:hypothetical protein